MGFIKDTNSANELKIGEISLVDGEVRYDEKDEDGEGISVVYSDNKIFLEARLTKNRVCAIQGIKLTDLTPEELNLVLCNKLNALRRRYNKDGMFNMCKEICAMNEGTSELVDTKRSGLESNSSYDFTHDELSELVDHYIKSIPPSMQIGYTDKQSLIKAYIDFMK